MDYNRENKGFVCFVYNLQRRRIFWFCVFLFVVAVCVCFRAATQGVADVLAVKADSARLIIALGALAAFTAPKSFALKILGYGVIFIGVILGVDYSTSDFSGVSKIDFAFSLPLNELAPSIFTPDFLITSGNLYALTNLISFILIGTFMLVMLLSWFVYNARSSEINDI